MAIKKIIHCADIHIRNYQRLEEYNEQLHKFVEACKEACNGYNRDEVRILISGDLVHSKLSISNELIVFTSYYLRSLSEVAKVLVISGNHDLLVTNTSRTDTLTALFNTADFEDCVFLDMALGYHSGCIVDDNVIWALYSIFDGFARPNIEGAREGHEDSKVIGLYHGMIVGAKLDNNTIAESGMSMGAFKGCDCVMSGDIHKRQVIKKEGVELIYPGSLIQQNIGESVSEHGFCLWDVPDMTHTFVDIENDHAMYNFSIKSVEDIDKDEERLINP